MSNYNQILFSGGLRGRLHRLRFEWLKKQLEAAPQGYSLCELGCFDCRSLSFIPQPKAYVGIDAGWEGGLDDARMTFLSHPWMTLLMAQSAHDLKDFEAQRFDYSVALESFQFMPDPILRGYLEFLAKVTTQRLIVTVPVEIGPVFLIKHLLKRTFSDLTSEDTDSYTLAEVWWATLGRVDHVRRFEHKGFDYRIFLKILSEYFDVTHIEGLPLRGAPLLSFQVGILASPKRRA